jgi:hypothetical protein
MIRRVRTGPEDGDGCEPPGEQPEPADPGRAKRDLGPPEATTAQDDGPEVRRRADAQRGPVERADRERSEQGRRPERGRREPPTKEAARLEAIGYRIPGPATSRPPSAVMVVPVM